MLINFTGLIKQLVFFFLFLICFQSNCNAIDSLSITYFGKGFTHIKYGDLEILTDPNITSLNAFGSLLGKVKKDTTLLKAQEFDFDNVDLILIGHSHYDHMMDLEYIYSNHINRDVPILGNSLIKNLLKENSIRNNVIDLAFLKYYIHDTLPLKIIPIKMGHGKNPIKYAMGEPKQKHNTNKARNWKCGQTYGYHIEFQENSNSEPVKVFCSTSHGLEISNDTDCELCSTKYDAIIYGAQCLEQEQVKIIRTFFANSFNFVFIHWESPFRKITKPFIQRLSCFNPYIRKEESMELFFLPLYKQEIKIPIL